MKNTKINEIIESLEKWSKGTSNFGGGFGLLLFFAGILYMTSDAYAIGLSIAISGLLISVAFFIISLLLEAKSIQLELLNKIANKD